MQNLTKTVQHYCTMCLQDAAPPSPSSWLVNSSRQETLSFTYRKTRKTPHAPGRICKHCFPTRTFLLLFLSCSGRAPKQSFSSPHFHFLYMSCVNLTPNPALAGTPSGPTVTGATAAQAAYIAYGRVSMSTRPDPPLPSQ